MGESGDWLVSKLLDGSPAELNGSIEVGDILTSISDEPLNRLNKEVHFLLILDTYQHQCLDLQYISPDLPMHRCQEVKQLLCGSQGSTIKVDLRRRNSSCDKRIRINLNCTMRQDAPSSKACASERYLGGFFTLSLSLSTYTHTHIHAH